MLQAIYYHFALFFSYSSSLYDVGSVYIQVAEMRNSSSKEIRKKKTKIENAKSEEVRKNK